MLTLSFPFLASSCAVVPDNSWPHNPCVRYQIDADPVWKSGFSGHDEWLAKRQWEAVVNQVNCERSGRPVPDVAKRVAALPNAASVWQPDDVSDWFETPDQAIDQTLALAEKRSDTVLERWSAKRLEQTKQFGRAFSVYQQIWYNKHELRAAHDIAFGLLHGWDGGQKDEWAALVWYQKAWRYGRFGDSQEACRILVKKFKSVEPDFCD